MIQDHEYTRICANVSRGCEDLTDESDLFSSNRDHIGMEINAHDYVPVRSLNT